MPLDACEPVPPPQTADSSDPVWNTGRPADPGTAPRTSEARAPRVYPADPFSPSSAPPARCSRFASSRSLSIIRRTSSLKLVRGFHPSAFVALDGSPSR